MMKVIIESYKEENQVVSIDEALEAIVHEADRGILSRNTCKDKGAGGKIQYKSSKDRSIDVLIVRNRVVIEWHSSKDRSINS